MPESEGVVYLRVHVGPSLHGQDEPIEIVLDDDSYRALCEKNTSCWGALITILKMELGEIG